VRVAFQEDLLATLNTNVADSAVEMRELRDWIVSCRRAGIKAKICDKLVSVVLPLEGNDDWKPRIDQRIACEPDSLVLFAY